MLSQILEPPPSVTPTIYELEQLQDIKQAMDDRGYAVVKIHTIDNDHLKRLFVRDMQQISPQYEAKTETAIWTSIDFPKAKMVGLMGEYGLSHGDAAWHVRTDTTIQVLYRELLGINDLVCSMDAVGFSNDVSPTTYQKWLHVDQNPYIPGGNINSIQGIYYAEDSHSSRAGTVVVPSSHLDWKQHDYLVPRHFHVVDQDKYWSKAVKLDIPAGCLLVYTSKLVHQGWHAQHRMCFMVAYGDKKNRDEIARQTKLMMYLGGHRSNHWSHVAQYHGEKWEHGSEWNMLKPQLINVSEDERQEVESFCEDYRTDHREYNTKYDTFIPIDRLQLI
jgi:hypothetical protein